MKLYYSRGACSLAPRIIINETQIPCEYVSVNLKTKRTESEEDYLQTNPKGSVPALETDTGELLTENAVILQYLAESGNGSKLLPPKTEFKHYRVLEWLNFVATDMHKGIGALFNPNFPEEVRVNVLIPMIKQKLNYLDKHLKDKDFIYDNHFTLPDAYLFVMLTWAKHFRFDFKEWPNISAYFEKLKTRRSIKQALEQEGLLITAH